VRRETAVARLTVIGARAVDRLIERARSDADPGVRAAALRALEGVGNDRALPAALAGTADADAGAAIAAIGVARQFLRGKRGAEAVDRLTTVALDARRPEAVRAAAVVALRDGLAGEPKTLAPLLTSLAADTSATVRAAAQNAVTKVGVTKPAGERPRASTPASIREWLAREGGKAPLSSLLAIVERMREREAAESAARRSDWTAARFAAHLILARRGSRVALYDLREALEQAAAPLPVDALAALALIGDASCLEPIASAFGRSKDRGWRDHLLETFHAITKREKLTPRHTAIKRILKRWPNLAQ